MSCDHKYRTNLDGLTIAGTYNSNDYGFDVRNKGILSPFVTIIFCEKCGHVAYNANYASKHEAERNTPNV